MTRTTFRLYLIVCWMGWVGAAAPTAHAQTPFSECIQNVDNATVVLPDTLDSALGGSATLASGDVVAAVNAAGRCVGQVAWTDGRLATLSIAGPSEATSDPNVPDSETGYAAGEVLSFRVYDASADRVVEIGDAVRYAACTPQQILCRDDGAYATNRIYVVDALGAGALPVELAGFDATRNGNRVVLQWQTLSETNNAGFAVQRADAGTSTWQDIGYVAGAGTTNEPQTYRFATDPLAPGTYRFRLKQTDLDGTTALSKEVPVQIALQSAFALSEVAPNPMRERGRLSLTVREGQDVAVHVYNVLGQRVATLFDGRVPANSPQRLELRANRLASGVYFIRVRGEHFTATRRTTLVR
ncbi:T9SS type A sorting domain-containing protein [Salisaeta longa]|uniref:T9SS type A sorting domain-containing protein n=1 Tax=Salisaeta longa TaxID=503170 RepID=UPI0003B4A27D|nr:T9SS type A sorting domain-containing protein [Salisaeta longa]